MAISQSFVSTPRAWTIADIFPKRAPHWLWRQPRFMPLWTLGFVVAWAVLFAAVASAALAQTPAATPTAIPAGAVVTIPSAVIDLSPAVTVLQQIGTSLVYTLVPLAVTAVFGWFAAHATGLIKWIGAKNFQTLQANLTAVATTIAGNVVAHGGDEVDSMKFNASSPEVAQAINRAIAVTPKLLDKLGVTPDALTHAVVSALGNAQTVMASGAQAAPETASTATPAAAKS